MSGIKLKSEKIPSLKIERIKWIFLLVLSHLFSFLISSSPVIKPVDQLPSLRKGFVRLQMQIHSQVPSGERGRDVLIMTSSHKLISNQGRLLRKTRETNSLNSALSEYLIELPEKDLYKLIKARGERLEIYPSSQKIRITKQGPRRNYEISF